MLQADDLPLADVIDEEVWQTVFDRYEVSFGNDEDAVYTPSITLGALISQVFFQDENRFCKVAVQRIASLLALKADRIVSTNSGAYCRARQKIPFEAVRDLVLDIALQTEAGYDLIRIKMLQNYSAIGRMPRILSFTTIQTLLATICLLGNGGM